MPVIGCGSQRTTSIVIWLPGPDCHSLPWHSAHPAKVMTCKTIALNVLADELGHQVRILGRTGILHFFAGREIQIGSEILAAANPPCLGKANGLGLVPFLRMGRVTGDARPPPNPYQSVNAHNQPLDFPISKNLSTVDTSHDLPPVEPRKHPVGPRQYRRAVARVHPVPDPVHLSHPGVRPEPLPVPDQEVPV